MWKAPRNYKVPGKARREARVPVVETVQEMLLLRDWVREEAPLVLRRHLGVTPGLPHMRLADIEGGLRHERAPRYTALCEGGLLGEGERRAVRVREANVLEVALERPAISHLLSARDTWLPHPRQHGCAVLGHACDVAGPE